MGFHVEPMREKRQFDNTKTTSQPRQRNNGLGFLSINDLTETKKRCKILWAGDPKDAGSYQEWAKVTVKVESTTGKKLLWTISESNPCGNILIEKLGGDCEDWIGRYIDLWCERQGVAEKKYMRVEVVPLEQQQQSFPTEEKEKPKTKK